MEALIAEILQQAEESRKVQEEFIKTQAKVIYELALVVKDRFNAGGKLLVFGNGGSAADAQHLAGELVNRFTMERAPLPAIALTTDTSVITAIGNDYSFDEVFEKQVLAVGKKEDVALGISTSGNSPNVIRALKAAKKLGMFTAGLTGAKKCKMEECCDVLIRVPSTNTPRIQEGHLLFLHLFSYLLEKLIFG